MDYLIPTAADLPAFTSLHMTTEAEHIPGGFRGIGEGGVIGGGSAIAAAVDDALRDLGVCVTRLPLTPPRLLALLDAACRTEVTRRGRPRRGCGSPTADARPAAARVPQLPALVAVGTHDPTCPPAMAEELGGAHRTGAREARPPASRSTRPGNMRSALAISIAATEPRFIGPAEDVRWLPAHQSRVSVITGDTEKVPFTGYGTGGSRGGPIGGATVLGASTRLRAKVLRIAAELLEAAADDLEIVDGRIAVAGAPEAPSVTMREIGDICYRNVGRLPETDVPGLEEREVFDPANNAFSYGTTAVLLEVDREPGGVTLLDYLLAHDCGTVINPLIVDGQLHGGAAQAIGGALYEEIVYSVEGQPLTTTLMDYLIPTAAEIPPFTTLHMETPAPHIPGGFKGMGEAGTISGPSAIASAIDDALADLGVHVTSLPVTPPRLHALITEAQEGQS